MESNSVLRFLRPDLYLTVLDPSTADFKKSAQEFMDRADAAIHASPPSAGFGVARSVDEASRWPAVVRIFPDQTMSPLSLLNS